jgi:cell division protein FtsN
MRERRNFNEEQPTYLSENKIFIIFAAITFVLFIALALFSYNSFIKGQESGEVVLIKSDEQPYKVTPEDPGGMKVNYQDKEVFNTLIGKEATNSNTQQATENVDEPSTPLSPEDVLRKEADAENAATQKIAENSEENSATVKTEAETVENVKKSVPAQTPETDISNSKDEKSEPKDAASATEPNASDEANSDSEVATTESTIKNVAINNGVIKIGEAKTAEAKPVETKAVAKKVEAATDDSVQNTLAKVEAAKNKLVTDAKKEKPKAAPVKEVAKKAEPKKADSEIAKNGKFFVQLSAYSSTHSLDKGWNDLKAKYGKAINGSKLVNKINRDGKTLYRLGFGPYKQKIGATEACNKLKAKGQDCIVRDM